MARVVRRGDAGSERGTGGRRHGDAPHGGARRRQRQRVAHAQPQHVRWGVIQNLDRAEFGKLAAERTGARGDRRLGSFEPQAGAQPCGRRARRQMRRTGHLVRALERRAHGAACRFVIEAEKYQRARRFGRRQHFQRHLGKRRERAIGSRHELRQIVARHVLDDAAARLERLAASGDAVKSQEMVARGALANTARTREVGCDRTAQGRAGIFAAEKFPPVARLEGEHLAPLGQRRLDLRHRRRRARGQHQLLGLVKADAGKFREVERVRELQRPAEAALAAAGEKLERLFARERFADDRRELRLVLGPEIRHACLKGAADRGTARGPDARAPAPARRSDGAAGIPCPD